MSEYNLDDDGSKYYICGGCGQACGCNDDEEVALRSRVKELEAERDTWVELRAVSDMRVKELRARVEELEAELERRDKARWLQVKTLEDDRNRLSIKCGLLSKGVEELENESNTRV